MNLYEIALPVKRNDGNTYDSNVHWHWQQCALAVAGGFTRRPVGEGAWKDKDGRVYMDAMIPYRVACNAVQWSALVAKAFELFPDQLALFTVILSHDVHIIERQSKTITELLKPPHTPRYRVDGKTVVGDENADWIGVESAAGPPYAVFDIVAQDHLPGRFSNLHTAQSSADDLNANTGEPPHGYEVHEASPAGWVWTTCRGKVQSEGVYPTREAAAHGACLDRIYERAHLHEWPDCNKCGGVHHPHRCPACL